MHNAIKTVSGDVWDAIARREMGSEDYTHLLMQANPQHIHISIFPAGIKLKIPKAPQKISMISPPWERSKQ